MTRYDVALVSIRLAAVLVLLYGAYMFLSGVLAFMSSGLSRGLWIMLMPSIPALLLGAAVARWSRSIARWIASE